jgi:hypothetical protein
LRGEQGASSDDWNESQSEAVMIGHCATMIVVTYFVSVDSIVSILWSMILIHGIQN